MPKIILPGEPEHECSCQPKRKRHGQRIGKESPTPVRLPEPAKPIPVPNWPAKSPVKVGA